MKSVSLGDMQAIIRVRLLPVEGDKKGVKCWIKVSQCGC